MDLTRQSDLFLQGPNFAVVALLRLSLPDPSRGLNPFQGPKSREPVVPSVSTEGGKTDPVQADQGAREEVQPPARGASVSHMFPVQRHSLSLSLSLSFLRWVPH